MPGEATVVLLPTGATSTHVLSSHLQLAPISVEAAAMTQTRGPRGASPIAPAHIPAFNSLLQHRVSTEEFVGKKKVCYQHLPTQLSKITRSQPRGSARRSR